MMWKRVISVLLLLILAWTPLVVQAGPFDSAVEVEKEVTEMTVGNNESQEQVEKVPSKQAHDERQKGAFIILSIIFVIALACFIAIGWVMKKSEK